MISPYLRWLFAFAAVVWIVVTTRNFVVASAINWTYFGTRTVPLRMVDVLTAIIVLYLIVVALSGKWWPANRRRDGS